MDSDFYSDHSFDSGGQEELFERLQKIKENDPYTTCLSVSEDDDYIVHMNDEGWEQLGRDIISNNTHLTDLDLYGGALNDHKMSCLFRGLLGSSSIKDMHLYGNELSVIGLRSMFPFLYNASNLTSLYLDDNNIQSAGFNELFRALRNSRIEKLTCDNCNIGSIEIDSEHIPKI